MESTSADRRSSSGGSGGSGRHNSSSSRIDRRHGSERRNHHENRNAWSKVESLTSPREYENCYHDGGTCGVQVLSELPECAIPLDCTRYADTSRSQGCCDTAHRYRNAGVREPLYEGFRVTITPLNQVVTPHTDHGGLVEFQFRRKNKVVTMQWETFEGSISQNGVAYLSVQQTISNLPPQPLQLPYIINYCGVNKVSFIKLEPSSTIQMKFYLDISGHGNDIKMGDHLLIPGGCVSWITAC